MRVIIRGNWAPCVGTDYCDALGIYDSLEAAAQDADDHAWETWEDDDNTDPETGEYEGEGPDYWTEEYDSEKHDMHKSGGGSFEDEFAWHEKTS